MPEKLTAPKILALKDLGQKVVCLTAYDFPTCRLADEAGVDLILVGDSVGNTTLGFESTLPVSMEDMIHHTAAAARAKPRALLVADMPFGSYQSSVELAVESAVELIKAGAEAVKLEGAYGEQIAEICRAGIPVMGHVGMTPQSVNAFGGFRVQGKGADGDAVVRDAKIVEESGAFSLVLELIPSELSKRITAELRIPTIGIGAGPFCDGQIQVIYDILGFFPNKPKHAKRYTEAGETIRHAIHDYCSEVREREFPSTEHSF